MTREMILIPKQKYEAVLKRQENEQQPCVETENSIEQSSDAEMHDKRNNNEHLEALVEIAIPKKYKEKAHRLLFYLKSHPSFQWNERGEISINNTLISKSHIIDLVRDLFVANGNRKPPVGIEQFYQFLKSIHVPKSLISNGKRKKLLQYDSSFNQFQKETEDQESEENEIEQF